MDRIKRYELFLDRFCSQEARSLFQKVTMDEIVEAQAKLRMVLPESYKIFLTEMGDGNIDRLSDAWRWPSNSLCPVPMGEIWSPKMILRQFENPWLGSIPAELAGGTAVVSDVIWKYLLPFGMDDNSSYWHCFPRSEIEADDLPVYIIDHDGGAIERVSNGFDELIEKYLELPRM